MRFACLVVCVSVALLACESPASAPTTASGADAALASDGSGATDAAGDPDIAVAPDVGQDADAGADLAAGPDAPNDAEDVATAAPDTAAEGDVPTPKGVEATTKSGTYTVLLDGPMQLKVAQKAAYTAWVTDSSGAPAEGLKPLVSFIHTAMGHGGFKNPTIQEIGGGAYAVASVTPSMSGTWRLSIQLVKGEIAKWDIPVTK